MICLTFSYPNFNFICNKHFVWKFLLFYIFANIYFWLTSSTFLLCSAFFDTLLLFFLLIYHFWFLAKVICLNLTRMNCFASKQVQFDIRSFQQYSVSSVSIKHSHWLFVGNANFLVTEYCLQPKNVFLVFVCPFSISIISHEQVSRLK